DRRFAGDRCLEFCFFLVVVIELIPARRYFDQLAPDPACERWKRVFGDVTALIAVFQRMPVCKFQCLHVASLLMRTWPALVPTPSSCASYKQLRREPSDPPIAIVEWMDHEEPLEVPGNAE